MTPITDTRPIFQASAEAVRLKRRFLEVNVGELIGYAEIRALIGQDPQNKGRGIVETARNHARREKGIVFGCVINQGYKRLNDQEIAELGSSRIQHIRSAAGRAAHEQVCADPEKLTNGDRTRYFTNSTILAFIRQSTDTKKVKAIEAEVGKKNALLEYKDAMLAMGR